MLSSTFLLCSLFFLIYAYDGSSQPKAMDSLSHFRTASWGAKRARTERYEVQISNIESSHVDVNPDKPCKICRPNCPHWNSLSKKERNNESVKWYMKNLTKEEKSVYRKKLNASRRQWYSTLSKEHKGKIISRISDIRRIRRDNLTTEERKEFYQKDVQSRQRKLDKMGVEERTEFLKSKNELATQTRKNRLASMSVEERRKWYKKNKDYSRKKSNSQRSPK
jgi:hypothetical protein